MANLCLLKCMDGHSALMADGSINRDLSFMCSRILLPNFGEQYHIFVGKVFDRLAPMPVIGFTVTIIAKAVGNRSF
jgi:hypothetical protein